MNNGKVRGVSGCGKSMVRLGSFFVVVVSLVFANAAHAATARTGVTYSLDAARTVTMSSSTIDFGTPTTSEILSGLSSEKQIDATVRANRNWKIQIKGSSPTWSSTAGGRVTKPVEDIQWKKGTGGSYASLTISNVLVDSNSGPTGINGSALQLFFKVYLKNIATNVMDPPANYTYSDVVFTVSSSV